MQADRENIAFIDQMRGFAILLVIFVHFSQNFSDALIHDVGKVGQFGVQLFFVASAFTLCLSHDRRAQVQDSLANFYIRRFFRIAPLYYLAIAGYGIAHTLLGHGQDYTPLNIAANVLFLHGFVPSANNSIVPGGWSIGVEMAFYAIFPFLYAGIEIVWRKWGMAALVACLAAAVAGPMALLCANLVLRGAWILNNTFAYYFLATQFPVFIIGIAYYLAAYRDGHWRPRPARDLTLAFAILAGCLAVILSGDGPLVAFMPTFAAVGFVFLAQALRAGGGGASPPQAGSTRTSSPRSARSVTASISCISRSCGGRPGSWCAVWAETRPPNT